MLVIRGAVVLGAATLALATASAFAQSERQEIKKYQRMTAENSPVELWELEGADLWKAKRGPNSVSLERCDLGMGPGVLKGAYAHLPRYFADTGRVQDLESRLVTCMTTLQGFTEKEATKRVFGNADKPSDMEYLSAYIAGRSRGVRMQVSTKNPKEKASYEMGKALFHYRAGPWDFSCASCHGTPNKRIRMQQLPVLSSKAGASASYTTWPGYRVSVSQLKTMEWRINDCFRQQRFPEPTYGSDAVVALTMYMAVNANGAVYRGPGTKR
jgi:L-cysteine S-thiosulfotransferase